MQTYLKKYILATLIFPLQLLSMDQYHFNDSPEDSEAAEIFLAQMLTTIKSANDNTEQYYSDNHQPVSDEDNDKNCGDEDNDEDYVDDNNNNKLYNIKNQTTFKKQIANLIEAYRQKLTYVDDMRQLLNNTPEKIYSQPCFKYKRTLLHELARVGMYTMIRECIEKYRFDYSARDSLGKTPLDYAAKIQNEKPQAFQYLAGLNQIKNSNSLQSIYPTKKRKRN